MLELGLLAALVVPCTQDEAPIERIHDLRALRTFAELDATVPDPRLPLHQAYVSALEADPEWLPWPRRGLRPDQDWGIVLRELLHEELADEIDWLEFDGNALEVGASEAGHRAVEEMLAALEALALRDCRVEVHLLEPEAVEACGALLSREQSRELLLSGAVLGSHVLRGRTGTPLSIEGASRQAFLSSYHVEVGQFSHGTDPEPSVLAEGLLGGVLLDEREDG